MIALFQDGGQVFYILLHDIFVNHIFCYKTGNGDYLKFLQSLNIGPNKPVSHV